MQIINRIILTTPRLTLICCDQEILEAVLKNDQQLAALLAITVPESWTEFGEPAFRWTYDKIMSQKDTDIKWWSYLPVLTTENLLVGSCGFKGDPVDGMVEIGYEVAANQRGKGLATEMAGALIKMAFQQTGILKVQAHTFAIQNESGSVLQKCGMKKVAEIEDPEDGKIWRWEIIK